MIEAMLGLSDSGINSAFFDGSTGYTGVFGVIDKLPNEIRPNVSVSAMAH